MFAWLRSLTAVVVLSILGLLTFIARALLDWRYVYPDFGMSRTTVIIGAAIYVAIVLFWVWLIMAAAQGRRGAVIALFGLNFVLLFLLSGFPLSQLYCPSPCRTIWPIGEIIIWSSTFSGLIAALASGLYLWRRNKAE